MKLRLVDRDKNEILEIWPREIRSHRSAESVVRKQWSGRVGGLGAPKTHVQAEFIDGDAVVGHWVCLETREILEWHAPDGRLVDRHLMGAEMRWAGVDAETATKLVELSRTKNASNKEKEG